MCECYTIKVLSYSWKCLYEWLIFSKGLSSCIYQYYLIQEKMTWYDAQKYCREKYTDLASADSIHDMQQMIASVSSGYIGLVWIGLYDNFWDWSWSMPDDGFYGKVNTSFSKWEVGQPNKVRNQTEICGAVLRGFWHDNQCDSLILKCEFEYEL
uniref:C-type lectin domain-containing protein n=1 Tax=Amphilophus citrinellus TaxID=61819 RepID=A0A3Q0TFC6_AMPCI